MQWKFGGSHDAKLWEADMSEDLPEASTSSRTSTPDGLFSSSTNTTPSRGRPSLPTRLISKQQSSRIVSSSSSPASAVFSPDHVYSNVSPEAEPEVDRESVHRQGGEQQPNEDGEAPTGDLSDRLRDQLKRHEIRRKLSHPSITSAARANNSRGDSPAARHECAPKAEDAEQISISAEQTSASEVPRKYFVLTSAGKPVYAYNPLPPGHNKEEEEEDDTDQLVTSAVGVMQAIISIFADEGDKLRYIDAGHVRISFLLRSPLYLVAVSQWGEPQSVLRTHLEYLHLHILSIITHAQLHRLFAQRFNFDLRRMLEGTEAMLDRLASRLQLDFSMATASLEVLRLEPTLRNEIGSVLTPPKQSTLNLLYALVICRGRVVTLLRPKKHSVHPSDLHILLNTTYSSPSLVAPGSESWIPICLPKFNPNGFLHALVSFIHKDLGMVMVTADKEAFFAMKEWKDAVNQRITNSSILRPLLQAAEQDSYSLGDIAVPGVRHFLYKSRINVQITSPGWQGIYEEQHHRQRLFTLYQRIYDALHLKPPAQGQGRQPAKLIFFQTQHEGVIGWSTPTFEVYIALGPLMPKTAAVHAAHGVLRWVQSRENELFLMSAPSF